MPIDDDNFGDFGGDFEAGGPNIQGDIEARIAVRIGGFNVRADASAHPCESVEEPDPCENSNCPPGERCVDGECVAEDDDNAEHAIPSLGRGLEARVPVTSFFVPQKQLDKQLYGENQISSVSRIKTVVDTGLLYSDNSTTRRNLDMVPGGTNEWVHLPGFAEMFHRALAQSGFGCGIADHCPAKNFDPIRYGSGHYWMHSKDTSWDTEPRSELMYFNRAVARFDGQPNQPHQLFDITKTDEQTEWRRTNYGQISIEKFRLEKWSDKINMRHYNGFPEGEHYGMPYEPNRGRYIYFPYLFSGPDAWVWPGYDGENLPPPMARNRQPEDLPKQATKESARQSFYTRGLFQYSPSGFIAAPGQRYFTDLVHDCNMPFFAAESEGLSMHTHLSVDLTVLSNYVTERFKLDDRRETLLPNL